MHCEWEREKDATFTLWKQSRFPQLTSHSRAEDTSVSFFIFRSFAFQLVSVDRTFTAVATFGFKFNLHSSHSRARLTEAALERRRQPAFSNFIGYKHLFQHQRILQPRSKSNFAAKFSLKVLTPKVSRKLGDCENGIFLSLRLGLNIDGGFRLEILFKYDTGIQLQTPTHPHTQMEKILCLKVKNRLGISRDGWWSGIRNHLPFVFSFLGPKFSFCSIWSWSNACMWKFGSQCFSSLALFIFLLLKDHSTFLSCVKPLC